MATKSDLDRELDTAPETEPEVTAPVLRDESDEIIDNLKQQLDALQGQLARYKRPPSTPPAPPARRRRAGKAGETLPRELAPQVAARLSGPSQDLALRLERLIEQTSDPEVRAELEHCRETAFFLFDTFHRISDNHQHLSDYFSAIPAPVQPLAMLDHLECSLHGDTHPVSVRAQQSVRRDLQLAMEPVAAAIGKLVQLAADISQGVPWVGIGRINAKPGEEPGEALLCFRIHSTTPWKGVNRGDDVSSLAVGAGLDARGVVDLFYAEKIVEFQGGELRFCTAAGHTQGFEVVLPFETGDQPPA